VPTLDEGADFSVKVFIPEQCLVRAEDAGFAFAGPSFAELRGDRRIKFRELLAGSFDGLFKM